MRSRKTTIKDIALKAGVSPRSVSYAINDTGRISKRTREKILRIAEEMNYKPNIMAKGLVNQKTYLIGVVLPYLKTSFFTDIISGIEEKSQMDGYDIILGNSSSTLESEKGAIQRMVNRHVDGIICCPDPRYFEFYKELLETGIPIIQIMTHVKGIAVNSLLVDDELGGEQATQHLLELGHSKIGFISYNEDYYREIQLRKQGYHKALINHGISLDLDRFEESCDLSIKDSYEAGKLLLDRNPDITAIFASTDIAAIGVLEACLEKRKRVPEDISVIGYDDIEIAGHQVAYPLTTVAQPKEKIGRIAYTMLSDLMGGKNVTSHILPPRLIIRNTTAPCS